MLNFEYFRIPRDDEFEDEPEDELASAGFRVVDGAEEEEEAADDSVEKEIDAVEAAVDDEDEEDTEGPADGLEELEELEKGVAAIPLGYDQDDD